MMKKRLILTTVLLSALLAMRAQTVVSGVVTDRQTGEPLPHVSVMAAGSEEHTVTNDDGRFTLKTASRPSYIQLSHIGYKTRKQQLGDGATENLNIALTSSTVMLSEVFVSATDPMDIVKAAMSRIEQNYSDKSELMRCFYRETARKGSRFISVAEAVTEMYKSPYVFGPERDAVAILKGRRLMSMKSSDTLGVKVQGGPVMPLMVDVAKNREYLLNTDLLNCCELHMDMPVKIGDRPHYVIKVVPTIPTLNPIMGGRLYIDQETLTISRSELELDVRDWRKAAVYMLVSKPLGLRFHPRELTVVVVYETDM